MEIKYRSGYAEGGFLDDGASVDPISGNEVPTGSLQEEVRNLSSPFKFRSRCGNCFEHLN